MIGHQSQARGKLSAFKYLVDVDLPAFIVHMEYYRPAHTATNTSIARWAHANRGHPAEGASDRAGRAALIWNNSHRYLLTLDEAPDHRRGWQ